MQIMRESIFTGVRHACELPLSQQALAAWQAGAPIQEVAPQLTPLQREFILTGITPDEWQNELGECGCEEIEECVQ